MIWFNLMKLKHVKHFQKRNDFLLITKTVNDIINNAYLAFLQTNKEPSGSEKKAF